MGTPSVAVALARNVVPGWRECRILLFVLATICALAAVRLAVSEATARPAPPRADPVRVLVTPTPTVAQLDAGFASLLIEARMLRARIRQQSRHVSDLRAAAENLITNGAQSAAPKSDPPVRETRWWRE